MKVFKFNRFGLLLLCAALAYVPMSTAYEYVVNGSVDWWRLGEGRIRLPFWLTFGLVLPVFLYSVLFCIAPAVAALLRGYEFKLDGDTLVVDGKPIRRSAIQSIQKSKLGGLLVRVNDGSLLRFRPSLSTEGEREFRQWIGQQAERPLES